MLWLLLGCNSVDWSECGPQRSRVDAPIQINGALSSDSLGQSLATGDVNGDGHDDVLVGVPNFDPSMEQNNAGQALLFLGADLTVNASLNVSDAYLSIEGLEEADGLGSSVGISDIDGDGLEDVWLGAYQADGDGQDSGVVYWFSGASISDKAGILSAADADIVWVGEHSFDYAGFTMNSAGDVDGDGVFDWLIGAHQADGQEEDVGKTYLILSSSISELSGVVSLSDVDTIFEGESLSDYSGYSVSGGVDIDGDDLSDVVIGAGNHDGMEEDTGAAYVFLGASIQSGTMALSQADLKLMGGDSGDWAGKTVHMIPSLDKDNKGDIAISASWNDGVSNNSGVVYLIRGSSIDSMLENGENEFLLNDADVILEGLEQESFFGQVVRSGDLDGDRYSDLIIGSPLHDDGSSADAGAVHIFFGKGFQEDWSRQWTTDDADQYIVGEDAYDSVGTSIETGDINRDRVEELILGIPYVDDVEMNAGGVSIFVGCES